MAPGAADSIRTFEARFDSPNKAARFLEGLDGKFGCLEGRVYAFSGFSDNGDPAGARVIQVSFSSWAFPLHQVPRNECADFEAVLSNAGAREISN
jgi:hypothetical protein